MDKNLVIQIMGTIMAYGYSEVSAAAVLGNWIAEGCLNPNNVSLNRVNNGYHEIGALGFTGGTAESFLSWCTSNGKKWDDLNSQAEYALKKTVPEYYPYFEQMGLWKYFVEIQKYLNCYTYLDKFKKATLIETAAISFAVIWWSPTYKQIHGGLAWASRDTGKYELTFNQRLEQEVRDRSNYAKEALEIYKEAHDMKDYIQSDSRWGSHPYAGENMAVAGCGPTSVADVISLVCDVLPPDVADYITSIGGASNGYGTYWEGITAACNHYGMECEQLNSVSMYGTVDSSAEKKFLEKMKTGDYVGILLMGAGFFCRGGHYIAVKSVNGDNTIQVLDVAYSPRSVCVNWYDNAPANAPGSACGTTVPYFRGRVKVFYLIKKKKSETPIPDKEPTTYTCTFRQIEPGMQGMPEIYIWEELMTAAGYYDGKLDFDYGPKLEKATYDWQRDNKDWITKKPLATDLKVGPACWRRAMHMTGSVNGSKISFILREKEVGETGTTCRFTQNVEKARGMYNASVDNSNGNKNAAGNIAYKTARGFKDKSGKITVEMLRDMCGGR